MMNLFARRNSPEYRKTKYPTQFWLMFIGLVISSTGTTMIWPFLTIFASQRLGLPMVAIMSLMTFNSVSGLISSVLAGAMVDRFGRKTIMAIGLFGAALVYAGYIGASQYWHFVILLTSAGLFSPLYRVATDAAVADVVSAEQRIEAYSIVRMGRNIGVALGPLLGGIVLRQSYTFGFVAAAVALSLYGIITVAFLKETLLSKNVHEGLREQFHIYKNALRNLRFSWMIGSFTIMEICAVLIWVLLAPHMKLNYGYGEAAYSWIPTTNALMVVFLQVSITSFTKRWRDTQVMPWGAAFYPVSMFIIALSRGFWGFWLGMVVLTLGELIVAPTASAYVANLAPLEHRGRYLGMFGLTWQMAMSVGPVGAGYLSDAINVSAPWFAGAIVGVLAVFSFWGLDRYNQRKQVELILND